jgi:hypothetical protein
MLKNTLVFCLATTLFSSFMPALSNGQVGYQRYVGMHPLEILQQDLNLRNKFRMILEEDFNTFLKNLELARNAELRYGLLISAGIARQFSRNDSAFFCVDTYSARVYAALFSDGAIVHFYGANSLTDLPEPVSEWALLQALRADPFYDPGTRLIGSP